MPLFLNVDGNFCEKGIAAGQCICGPSLMYKEQASSTTFNLEYPWERLKNSIIPWNYLVREAEVYSLNKKFRP
jgi:hypothetical protein